jgi:hypothetical protein
LGLVGGFANLLLRRNLSDLARFLFLSIYPMMLLILLVALFARRLQRWALVLLLILSFSLIWYKVLNGYDFMKG